MNKIEQTIYNQTMQLTHQPSGAFSLRVNGQSAKQKSTNNIIIKQKQQKNGIDVIIKPNTQNESLHLPVILSDPGLKDSVYNDFYIGDNANIKIISGCGIHNDSNLTSTHNGIHTFHIGNNSFVEYIERHIALGLGKKKKLNPKTKIKLGQNSTLKILTQQISGVSNSNRITQAKLGKNSSLIIEEKICTSNTEEAISNYNIELNGYQSSCKISSRSVAKNNSRQIFESNLIGKNKCFGHVECDGIILDKAKMYSTPKISAENSDSTLIHEATIGKIAGEQLTKLMTLGLNKEQAEEIIINGYLC